MNKNVKKRFGKNLQKYRRQRRLSQEELSLELDLDGSYIGKVENAIADYFEIDVVELFK